MSGTREIDRVENELNKTKEETETKIQGETNERERTTKKIEETGMQESGIKMETAEIKCIETQEVEEIIIETTAEKNRDEDPGRN